MKKKQIIALGFEITSLPKAPSAIDVSSPAPNPQSFKCDPLTIADADSSDWNAMESWASDLGQVGLLAMSSYKGYYSQGDWQYCYEKSSSMIDLYNSVAASAQALPEGVPKTMPTQTIQPIVATASWKNYFTQNNGSGVNQSYSETQTWGVNASSTETKQFASSLGITEKLGLPGLSFKLSAAFSNTTTSSDSIQLSAQVSETSTVTVDPSTFVQGWQLYITFKITMGATSTLVVPMKNFQNLSVNS